MNAKPELPVSETRFRGARATVDTSAVQVDRNGGRFEAGIMRGVSLIALGEALGHELWIDETTLSQVSNLANDANLNGVKARFTHPSMSSDGMGRLLGRIHDVTASDGRVVGDLHFAKSAHDTPDGDLADYVMTLASEDPRAAGLSIVFDHDAIAMSDFAERHTDDEGAFASPDEANTKNYRHVRLASLRAADVVDEPAANPEGLFDNMPLARNVDHLLSYAAGIIKAKPDVSAFGVDPDRAKQFLSRWLNANGFSLTPKKDDAAMADNQTPSADQVEPVPTKAELLAQIKIEQRQFADRFGATDGNQWHADELSYADAMEKFADKQAERINELEIELAEQVAKFESLNLGESEGIETTPGDSSPKRSLYEATSPGRN